MADNVGQLIETYIKYRDFRKAKEDEHKAAMKPYADAMDLIEAQILSIMKRDNVVQIKGAAGTAYQAMHTRFSVENKDQFVDYLFGLVRDDDPEAANFISNVIPKEPIQAYMDGNNGMLPPGILVNRELSVNIRRT